MIDVFLATISHNRMRELLCDAVIERWKLDPLCRLHIQMDPRAVPINRFTGKGEVHHIPSLVMQRDRRIQSDALAESDIYIVTDDDCMPIGVDFIKRGVAAMEAHPNHAVLAALNVRSDTLFRNGVPPYTGEFIDDDVWQAHAVGGIRFCRKGIVMDWSPSADSGSYDMQHQEGIEKAGYKAGYLRNVLMNHLGEGLSTHWPSGKNELELLEEGNV